MKAFIGSLGITLGVLVCLSWVSFFREPPVQVLCDSGAEIQAVVCSLSSARTSSLRNTALLTNIVNALPRDIQVIVLVKDLTAFKKNSPNQRVKFIEVPNDKGISIWPQDPFVVVSNGEQTRLIAPRVFEREDDEIMPVMLGAKLSLEVVHSELCFEGGNIVCGEESVLIGYDTIALNAKLYETSFDDIESRFAELFGRPVITVGTESQAIGHIDLVVTPLAGKKIAIADSRAGAVLARTALQDAPGEIKQFEQACESNFFGRADITELADLSGKVIRRPQIVEQTQVSIEASVTAADSLDAIARQMTEGGLEVVRIPALVPDVTSKFNEEGKETPGFPFITYNNVLLENRSQEKIVYLPQYGCRPLDEAGAHCWTSLGYTVKTIKGFSTSAMYGGALRCCTKVLARKG